MKKLRLLMTDQCSRACAGCCNKDWNLKALPVCEDLTGWNEVIMTGGEPMLVPKRIIDTALAIPHGTRILVYTAKIDNPTATLGVLSMVHGMTITLHDQADVPAFIDLNNLMDKWFMYWMDFRTLRLNVFKGVELPSDLHLGRWAVKRDIEWIPNCPLPRGEVFMRHPNAFHSIRS